MPSQHVYPTQTAQIVLVGPRPPHGDWPHPKRHPLWRPGTWEENYCPPTATIQACLKEGHKGSQHRHWVLGGPYRWPHEVEKHSECALQEGKRSWLTQQQTSGHTERSTTTPTKQLLHIDVTIVAETVTSSKWRWTLSSQQDYWSDFLVFTPVACGGNEHPITSYCYLEWFVCKSSLVNPIWSAKLVAREKKRTTLLFWCNSQWNLLKYISTLSPPAFLEQKCPEHWLFWMAIFKHKMA